MESLTIIDITGHSKSKKYAIYVRDLEKKIQTFVNPMGELLWKEGLYKGSREKEGTGLRTIDCIDLFNFVSEVIKSGHAEGLLYRSEK